MKQINLLPYDYQRKLGQKRLLSTAGVIVVVLIVTLGSAYFYLNELGRLYNEQLSTLQSQQNNYLQKQSRQLQSQQAAQQDIITRINSINTYSKAELSWPKIFNQVAALIPQDTQLSALSYAQASNGLTVKMSGTSPSNLSFASFVQFLQNDKALTSWNVDSYVFTPSKGTVSFGITVKLPGSVLTYQAK